MKILIPVAIAALAIVVVVIIKCISRSGFGSISAATQAMTLEDKLRVLAECGLVLENPFKPEDLLSSWDREEYEKQGFDLALCSLGSTEEEEPWRNHCVNLWYFDTECIEDHGAYKRIVERMVHMAQGSLILENIQDYVDLEEAQAWFSFSFQGKEIKVDCKVNDDWVDTDIFSRFAELLAVADSSKVFFFYDTGDQNGLIGCVKSDDFKKLKSLGIKFVPLK